MKVNYYKFFYLYFIMFLLSLGFIVLLYGFKVVVF